MVLKVVCLVAVVTTESVRTGNVDNNGMAECAGGVREREVDLRCYDPESFSIIFPTFS